MAALLDVEDHDGMTEGSSLSCMRSPEYQKLAKKRSSRI